jgi:predicted alpha/beta-hydrolase family hydrolase
MLTFLRDLVVGIIALHAGYAGAQYQPQVVDITTRPGVSQRFLLSAPPQAKAAVILFAGGHGGLQIDASGHLGWGSGNFLVRSAPLFAAQGLAVAVIDAPSDRQSSPYLSGFRQTVEHATDVEAVITALKQRLGVPVWLVGTSRGTQSAAFVATQPGAAADGLVLTSTILTDPRSRPVPDMPLSALKIPVLVVHHEQDGCRLCRYSDVPRLMDRLGAVPRHELVTFTGGSNVGDPCEARAYHGYNGIEAAVVSRIAGWILQR